MSAPEPDELHAAIDRLAGRVRRTPVLELQPGDLPGVPGRLRIKLELHQHTGAFKARGALNAALIAAQQGATEIVAASGGNHGAAAAWAAGQVKLPATIFVPAFTPAVKTDRIVGYGARLVRVEGFFDDALAVSLRHAAETGAAHVHAYDAPEVVAGQATLGAELAEQVPADVPVLVACGGGGLYAGVALALAGRNPVRPVEPVTAPTLSHAVAAGEVVPVDVGGVAVDALGARRVGTIALEVAQRHHAEPLLVPDSAVVAARTLLWDELRIAAEPGGATALAAVLSGACTADDVCVVVSGGNAAQPEPLPAATDSRS